MRKTLSIIGLGLVSVLSANQYYDSYRGQGPGPGYYQDQPGQGQVYYQDQPRQGQGYYQDQPRQDMYQGGYRDDSRYDNAPSQRYSDQKGDSRDSRNVPDQEISKNVQDLLEPGIFSRGYPNVKFNVNNGNVTLRGSANTQDDKMKIEDNVKKIKGVRQVNNQMTLMEKQMSYGDTSTTTSDMDAKVRDAEKNYPQDSASTEADKRINARIREKISDGWFTRSYEGIVLRTNNGVVTIVGVVDSRDDVQKINDKLKDVGGIRSVNNQLSTKKNK